MIKFIRKKTSTSISQWDGGWGSFELFFVLTPKMIKENIVWSLGFMQYLHC
jgi:hypothetical protein